MKTKPFGIQFFNKEAREMNNIGTNNREFYLNPPVQLKADTHYQIEVNIKKEELTIWEAVVKQTYKTVLPS